MAIMKKVKQRVLNYNAIFQEEPEGGYTVVVPSLPGCVTYGKNFEVAKEMVAEAIEAYLESLAKHGEKIPTDSSIFASINVPFPQTPLAYA